MAKKLKALREYKLPNPLVYRLSNPNYTIYHRAALGGLAATIQSWDDEGPDDIKAEVDRDQVRLSWDESLSDQEFLHRLISASFKLDVESKLIELPGQRIKTGIKDLRLAIHNGIAATFLQHNKMRPGEKKPRMLPLSDADGKELGVFSYKAVNEYAHRKAQGLGLLDAKGGAFPATTSIPQWMVPGATGGAAALQTSTDEVILLMYLMVGCAAFLLRSRSSQEKAQACVIVPDVIDLLAFATAIKRIAASGQKFERFSNSYLGRVVGGAEEAALSFLLDLHAEKEVTSEHSVRGCVAVAMGKVAWDKNQTNRSLVVKVRDDYDEIAVFRAAKSLGRSVVVKTDLGDFVVPSNPLPELVAANLTRAKHWCANFRSLVSEKKGFERMLFSRGGLNAMKESVKDTDDQAVIRAFQEAWKYKMGALGERARNEGLDFRRLVEVERERTRNDILRTKTSEMLASWFMRFCADATRGSSLATLREKGESIRKFIFNSRNFERFQNLCLFALVSYASDEAKSAMGGVN